MMNKVSRISKRQFQKSQVEGKANGVSYIRAGSNHIPEMFIQLQGRSQARALFPLAPKHPELVCLGRTENKKEFPAGARETIVCLGCRDKS